MPDFQEVFNQLDQYVTQRMQVTRTPGMMLALFDQEKCCRVSSYGLADLEAQTSVTPDTLFLIGSITKSFTAVAVVQAVEVGLLDLYAPVTDYLPWFCVPSQYAPITLHNLLTHSAGIVTIIDQSPDARGAVWALRETVAAWPPGTHFYYSDAGYQVLGLVLEEVMGQPFQHIIQSGIFDPLEMTKSEAALTHAMRPHLAKSYRYLYDDRPYHRSHPLVPVTWVETNAGDCCIASTATDMAKYGRMLLNHGQGSNGTLLSKASHDLLTRYPIKTGWCCYGYGLEIHQYENFLHIGHGGEMPGYEAVMMMDTDNELGVVLLSTQPSISVRNLGWNVLSLWRRIHLGQSLSSNDWSSPDPSHVENASDFAGTYRNEDKTLVLTAEDKHLVLNHQGTPIVLEKRGNDCFYVNHPDFDCFLLRFGRAETSDITEACHGANWYISEKHTGSKAFDSPAEWSAYPGHYRAHNPWQTNFRVILRKGTLWLVWPDGDEEALTALEDGTFRIGDDISPERLRFKQIINGKALRANLSVCDYYRFFTP